MEANKGHRKFSEDLWRVRRNCLRRTSMRGYTPHVCFAKEQIQRSEFLESDCGSDSELWRSENQEGDTRYELNPDRKQAIPRVCSAQPSALLEPERNARNRTHAAEVTAVCETLASVVDSTAN